LSEPSAVQKLLDSFQSHPSGEGDLWIHGSPQAKAEVAYQLGNVNMQSIDPLLQVASPEEMWNIVAEICQGRPGGDNPTNLSVPSASSQQKKKKTWRSVLMFLALHMLIKHVDSLIMEDLFVVLSISLMSFCLFLRVTFIPT